MSFLFGIDDKVKILPLDLKGKVLSILVTKHGVEYQVRYFWNSEAKEVFFAADELVKEKE